MQTVVDKCVRRIYGAGAESKVRFEFVESDEVTPDEYLEMARKVKDLGLAVDVQKLRELTGLQFIKDTEADLWSPKGDDAE